ncbi:hypothetical protein [Turicibacter sanguinis]|uniref:hypothetical protein n=1 Tax=Turicibacter sanguinis TaxID=154288 RepID=UPI0018A9FB8E|nr:hypothetical protein [Turicibacter sanguinis]MDB8554048.1 hypothetical protein [Turicibacter sanguinis]
MNGLEAIELMKQGKKVSIVDAAGFYQIKDGRIWLTYPTSKVTGEVLFFDLSNTYCEYIEPKPLTGWERVDKHEKYVSIALCQKTKCVEFEDEVDDEIYGIANYFSIEEKAEEINFKQTLFRKLQRFSDENGGGEIDWNNANQEKWMIKFDHESNELCVGYNSYFKIFGQVHFISEEIAKKAIELFRDELIEYFTHDWSGKNEASTVVNSKER